MITPIAEHLIESTVFAGFIALVALYFANNRAAVRYGLWFAASVKFLIPFSLISAAGEALRWETAPVVALDLSWSAPGVTPGAISAPTIGGDMTLPAAPTSMNFAEDLSGPGPGTVLIVIWLAGSAFLLGRWLIQWLRLWAVRSTSTAAPIDAPIPVRYSRSLVEPGLAGIFRPVLLLPEGIVAQLSPAQLALVIAHELCHWRRRDNLTAALHMFAQVVFWFHPLVWWIGTRLVVERERACDESVLATCSNPIVYADSLLEVCRFCIGVPLACASGVGGANLKHRMERIMENAKVLRLSPAKLVLLTVIVAGTVLLPMASGLLRPSAAAATPQPEYFPVTDTPARPAPVAVASSVAKPEPPAVRIVAPAQKSTAAARRQTARSTVAVRVAEQGALPAEAQVAAATPAAPAGASAPRLAPPASTPPEELLVTGKMIREFLRIRNFVRSYTAPSSFLDQISRWEAPFCIKTQGLAPGYNAFITKRLKEVAAEIGAPGTAEAPCEPNLNVVFTLDPQAYVDDIKANTPVLLGVHYPSLLGKIATVSYPIQAWYATGTRGSRGAWRLDSYDGFYVPVFIVPGSHLDSGLTSSFAMVTVVVDLKKVEGLEVGAIADYIAMAALARTQSFDRCQQVPSITNALGDCRQALKTTALSDFDKAYLKALYSSRSNVSRSLQESEIGFTMRKILEKQLAGK